MIENTATRSAQTDMDVAEITDKTFLENRYRLRTTKYLSERFAKSPNIINQIAASEHLPLSYAAENEGILPYVKETFVAAYPPPSLT